MCVQKMKNEKQNEAQNDTQKGAQNKILHKSISVYL